MTEQLKRLAIVRYGNPVLTEKAETVSDLSDDIIKLIANMTYTMYENDGVGLAAPQVGHKIRLFITGVPNDHLRVFINPELEWTSNNMIFFTEGCLSCPKISLPILRPDMVVVRALDQNFDQFKLEASELLARAIQHELDHLNGILFVDRAGNKT